MGEPSGMEKWFAKSKAEQQRNEETPEERMARLRARDDQPLTEMLQRLQSIRLAQESGSGVREDAIELDRVFLAINKRLGELGEPQLGSKEDLP